MVLRPVESIVSLSQLAEYSRSTVLAPTFVPPSLPPPRMWLAEENGVEHYGIAWNDPGAEVWLRGRANR
jgi:hypothetical protein